MLFRSNPPLNYTSTFTASLTVEYTSPAARKNITTADAEEALAAAVGGLVSGCLDVHVNMLAAGKPDYNEVTFYLGDPTSANNMSKQVIKLLLDGICSTGNPHFLRVKVKNANRTTTCRGLAAVSPPTTEMTLDETIQAMKRGLGERGVTYEIGRAHV